MSRRQKLPLRARHFIRNVVCFSRWDKFESNPIREFSMNCSVLRGANYQWNIFLIPYIYYETAHHSNENIPLRLKTLGLIGKMRFGNLIFAHRSSSQLLGNSVDFMIRKAWYDNVGGLIKDFLIFLAFLENIRNEGNKYHKRMFVLWFLLLFQCFIRERHYFFFILLFRSSESTDVMQILVGW